MIHIMIRFISSVSPIVTISGFPIGFPIIGVQLGVKGGFIEVEPQWNPDATPMPSVWHSIPINKVPPESSFHIGIGNPSRARSWESAEAVLTPRIFTTFSWGISPFTWSHSPSSRPKRGLFKVITGVPRSLDFSPADFRRAFPDKSLGVL